MVDAGLLHVVEPSSAGITGEELETHQEIWTEVSHLL